MKCCREILLDVKVLAMGFCKVRYKSWISIRDDVFGGAKPQYQMFQILIGNAWAIDHFVIRNEFCHFEASLINNSENTVIPI